LKPASQTAVNGKRPVNQPGAEAEMSTCSTLGPFHGKVQRACNTPFEFDLSCLRYLDKIPIWQHAGGRLVASPKST
jgi:hypothetical protein